MIYICVSLTNSRLANLHPEADAEERPVLLDVRLERLRELFVIQGFHCAAKGSHTGEDNHLRRLPTGESHPITQGEECSTLTKTTPDDGHGGDLNRRSSECIHSPYASPI